MTTPKTGRPEGRPSKGFFDDPDRYSIAMADGFELLGTSQRIAYDIAAIAAGGQECDPTKRPRARRPPDWVHTAFKLPTTVSVAGRSSTLRKKAKKFESSPEAAAWRKKMGLAFAIAFNPKRGVGLNQLTDAIMTLADAVDERDFVEPAILPMLRE